MAQNWGQTEMDFGMFLSLYLSSLQRRKKSVAVLTALLEEPKEALNFFSLFLETTDISNFSSYMS